MTVSGFAAGDNPTDAGQVEVRQRPDQRLARQEAHRRRHLA
jgi:hypothetical protein